jgi:hypothetical protein
MYGSTGHQEEKMTRRAAAAKGELSAADLDAKLDEMDPPGKPDDPRMGIPEGWEMIHTLMSRILADVGPVAKDQVNALQKYNFRGVDQVVNAVNSAFKRHRVYITSEIVEARFQDTHTTANKPTREVTGRVRFTFHAPDGSSTTSEVLTESLDQSDKGGPKAMSVALRICLLQALLLPTTDPTTDDDGHYHTRDGVGSMSRSMAAFLMGHLKVADLAELLGPIRGVINEHAAWDRDVPSGNGTWQANFMDRIVWLIQSVSSYEEGKATKEALAEAKLLSAKTQGGQTLADLLSARGQELRELFAKTHDHVMAQIMAAKGQDELDIAIGCGWAALEAGTILEKALDSAVAIAEERRAKLPEYAPQPDDGELGDAAAAGEEPGAPDDVEPPFDPPYVPGTEPQEDTGHRGGYDRDAFFRFKERADQATIAGRGEEPLIQAAAVAQELASLLLPDDEGVSAATFGTDGFIVVDDAIKAAHRREQTITDAHRAELDDMLARHRADAGV